MQYLFKNPSKTTLLVLFDIRKIDFDNINSSNDIDNESIPQYLCFDFLYFIKQMYGIDIYFQFVSIYKTFIKINNFLNIIYCIIY